MASSADAGSNGHDTRLFEGGLRRFTRDMVVGLRADMRTIMDIRTMRYALVGVAARERQAEPDSS